MFEGKGSPGKLSSFWTPCSLVFLFFSLFFFRGDFPSKKKKKKLAAEGTSAAEPDAAKAVTTEKAHLELALLGDGDKDHARRVERAACGEARTV